MKGFVPDPETPTVLALQESYLKDDIAYSRNLRGNAVRGYNLTPQRYVPCIFECNYTFPAFKFCKSTCTELTLFHFAHVVYDL